MCPCHSDDAEITLLLFIAITHKRYLKLTMMNPRQRNLLSFLILLLAACSISFGNASHDVVELVSASEPENEAAMLPVEQPRRQLFWSLVFLGTCLPVVSCFFACLFDGRPRLLILLCSPRLVRFVSCSRFVAPSPVPAHRTAPR